MRRAALTLGWLVVLPSLVVWAAEPELVAELRIDTSRASAARIHPGMTLAEVEQIIGGPPKDYRAKPRFEFVSGNNWPRTLIWTTRNGRIVVTDGRHGFRRDPATDQLVGWSTGDGIVDDVRWESVEDVDGTWAAAAARAALVYGMFAISYVCFWVIPRRAAAGCPAPGGGG